MQLSKRSREEEVQHSSGAMMAKATAVHMSSSTQLIQNEKSASPPVTSIQPPATTATEDEDESEDESEILEESPCGRWQKRREEVRSTGTNIWIS